MSHRYTEEEMVVCKRCGKSYIPKYKTCPYCLAMEKMQTGKRSKSFAERLISVVLVIAVVAGACGICFNMIRTDNWVIGREHAVTANGMTSDQVTSGVTEEEVVLSSANTETTSPEESESPETETPTATETPAPEG